MELNLRKAVEYFVFQHLQTWSSILQWTGQLEKVRVKWQMKYKNKIMPDTTNDKLGDTHAGNSSRFTKNKPQSVPPTHPR